MSGGGSITRFIDDAKIEDSFKSGIPSIQINAARQFKHFVKCGGFRQVHEILDLLLETISQTTNAELILELIQCLKSISASRELGRDLFKRGAIGVIEELLERDVLIIDAQFIYITCTLLSRIISTDLRAGKVLRLRGGLSTILETIWPKYRHSDRIVRELCNILEPSLRDQPLNILEATSLGIHNLIGNELLLHMLAEKDHLTTLLATIASNKDTRNILIEADMISLCLRLMKKNKGMSILSLVALLSVLRDLCSFKAGVKKLTEDDSCMNILSKTILPTLARHNSTAAQNAAGGLVFNLQKQLNSTAIQRRTVESKFNQCHERTNHVEIGCVPHIINWDKFWPELEVSNQKLVKAKNWSANPKINPCGRVFCLSTPSMWKLMDSNKQSQVTTSSSYWPGIRHRENEPIYNAPRGLALQLLIEGLQKDSRKNTVQIVYDKHTSKVPKFSKASSIDKNSNPSSSYPDSLETTSLNTAGEDQVKIPTLQFESRFECGNLQRAIKTGDTTYDLLLSADLNSKNHVQWFYFRVQNMRVDVKYRFRIINNEKPHSAFSNGMRPVMHSATQDRQQGIGWCRSGGSICYIQNLVSRNYQQTNDIKWFGHASNEISNLENQEDCGTLKEKYHYTLTFDMQFPYSNDTVFIAYFYPFSLTFQSRWLDRLMRSPAVIQDNCLRRQVLTKTVGGNNCDLLTITNFKQAPSCQIEKHVVILTARIHPGEVNTSWIIKGLVEFLCSDAASEIRTNIIFKIVPMLNPDGVVVGNSRCSLKGYDLNRKWKDPQPEHEPVIAQVKAMIKQLSASRNLLMVCDFHGHSNIKGLCLYGCEGNLAKDSKKPTFASLLSKHSESFSLRLCRWKVKRNRAGTARQSFWRELEMVNSYTLEASFCTSAKGKRLWNTTDMETMGADFCLAVEELSLNTKGKKKRTKKGSDEK